VVNRGSVTVEDVCTSYLDKAKESRGKNKTNTGRRRSLYVFCCGFSLRLLDSDEQAHLAIAFTKSSPIVARNKHWSEHRPLLVAKPPKDAKSARNVVVRRYFEPKL
jgi:hypothetical protein